MDGKKLNIQLEENNFGYSLEGNLYSTGISMCGSQCLAAKMQIEALTNSIQVKDNRIKDVEDQLSEMQIKLSVYKEKLIMYNEQIEDKDDRIKDIENQLTQIKIKSLVDKERIILYNEKIKERDDLIATSSKEFSFIKDQMDKLSKEVETDIRKKNKLIEELQAQIGSQKAEFASINSSGKKLEQNNADFKSEITKKINHLNDNKKHLNEWENQIRVAILTKLRSVSGLELFEPTIESGIDEAWWIVIMRRRTFSETFGTDLNAFHMGFDNPDGSFWIGLEKIHKMTEIQRHELYIQFVLENGKMYYTRYDNFKIGKKEDGYELNSLGEYTGYKVNQMNESIGEKFSYVPKYDCYWWSTTSGYLAGKILSLNDTPLRFVQMLIKPQVI